MKQIRKELILQKVRLSDKDRIEQVCLILLNIFESRIQFFELLIFL